MARTQERLQAHFGRFDKTLLKKRARLGLTRRVGQGCGDTADQTRIVLADIDLDPHEAPARHTRAVTNE